MLLVLSMVDWRNYDDFEGDAVMLLVLFGVALVFAAGVAWMARRQRRQEVWEID